MRVWAAYTKDKDAEFETMILARSRTTAQDVVENFAKDCGFRLTPDGSVEGVESDVSTMTGRLWWFNAPTGEAARVEGPHEVL